LSLGERLDLRAQVKSEGLPQFLGIGIVPARIERARVAHQLLDTHPRGKIVFFGEVTHAREHADRIGDRIETEDPHRSALRSEQAEQVPDQRGLARAVDADQAVHRAGRHREADRVKG